MDAKQPSSNLLFPGGGGVNCLKVIPTYFYLNDPLLKLLQISLHFRYPRA